MLATIELDRLILFKLMLSYMSQNRYHEHRNSYKMKFLTLDVVWRFPAKLICIRSLTPLPLNWTLKTTEGGIQLFFLN